MRHQKPYRKLSRQRSHYRALMRNMTFSLLQHERINTTLAKAKEVRPFVDKIITLAKAGGLHARRQAFALMGNKVGTAQGETFDLIGKVFQDASKKFKSQGGYTRIIRLGRRPGDAAPMAILELVGAAPKLVKPKKGETTEASEAAPAAEKKPAPKKAKAKAEKKAAAG